MSVAGRLAGDVKDALAVVDRHEEVAEHQGDDSHQLHQNVQSRPGGVLQGVANLQ